jgi:hypothetical protein
MSEASELSRITNQIGLLCEALPDAKERRRYALLQAAATVYAGYAHFDIEATSHEAVVEHAEQILAEIEKREKERQS